MLEAVNEALDAEEAEQVQGAEVEDALQQHGDRSSPRLHKPAQNEAAAIPLHCGAILQLGELWHDLILRSLVAACMAHGNHMTPGPQIGVQSYRRGAVSANVPKDSVGRLVIAKMLCICTELQWGVEGLLSTIVRGFLEYNVRQRVPQTQGQRDRPQRYFDSHAPETLPSFINIHLQI